MCEKIQSNNKLLENKVARIQKEAFRVFAKQIQVEEEEINTNSVFVIVQNKVSPTEKQTTKTPY